MPRNPPAKRNQHNNRHETGLVGPGKRVTKQKSNGHLNGNVKPVLPDEPIPTASNIDAHSHALSSGLQGASHRSDAVPALRKRASESSTDGQDGRWEGTNGNTGAGYKRSGMAPFKSRSAQDLNAVHIASTILKSCPAGDTVALLIVLLALPSIVLTMVQALFASLTLVPPNNSSSVSFLSLFDVFQGTTGSPSLGTMAVVDVICLGLWVGLWTWAQNFALDLAQIQIAITLGNGNSGGTGSVNVFCFIIVLVLHSVRSPGVRRFFLSNLVPGGLSSNPWLSDLAQYLPAEADFGSSPGPPSKIRSLFAIHILSQGFMAFVRRWVSSNQSSSSTRSARRTDADLLVTSANSLEPINTEAANTASASGVELQPPSTPGFKDSKEKAISAKKRRRQGMQSRRGQPFWAALASTKVHVLRDFEHGQSNRVRLVEKRTLNLAQPHDAVWVTNVEPSTIQFEAVLTATHDQESDLTSPADDKPFCVRINCAKWQSVTLEPIDDPKGYSRWSGTISGLAPDCTYTCAFNRGEDDLEFASVMVKTPALQDSDMLAATPARGSLRPSSPTSTLRTSIQNANVQLNEAKQRVNKTKRGHRSAVQRIDKEIDTLNQRLRSSGDDTRQRQKLLQADRSTQQNQDAIVAIEEELDNFQVIPEDETEEYDQKKATHDDRKKLLNTAQAGLDEAKQNAHEKVQEVKTELNAITSRKERLKKRQEQLSEQFNRITEANARGLNEKERKAAESAAIDAQRQGREMEYQQTINGFANELRRVQNNIMNISREIDVMDQQIYKQRDMMLNNGPLTPEGNLPGTNPPQPRTVMFGSLPPSGLANSTLAPETRSSPFLDYAKTLPSGMRPRSNTNRSNGAISNFSADFDDADPIPPMPSTFDGNGSADRKSSGSSRGQNNGSPAGIIGEGVRSPPRVSNSPASGLLSSGTW